MDLSRASRSMDEQDAVTRETPQFTNIVVKIEKCDSEPEDIFEPEIQLEIEPKPVPSPKKAKPKTTSRTKKKDKEKTTATKSPENSLVTTKRADKSPATTKGPDQSPVTTKDPEQPPTTAKTAEKKPRVDDPEDLTCKQCGHTFSRRNGLRMHRRMIHKERLPANFTCHLCDRSFRFKIQMIRHLRDSNCTLEYPCGVCKRSFKSEEEARQHALAHGERPYKCDRCGKRFKGLAAMKGHLWRHDNSPPRPFPCSVCGKSFPVINALEAHLRTHTKERPFQCAVCSRAFSHKHNMMRHTARHNKVLQLKCEVCQKEFPRPSRLKYHMRVHYSDKKPYNCTQCHKTYSHLQNITRHYRKKHPHVEYIPAITDAEFANKEWQIRMEQDAKDEGYIVPELKRTDLVLKQEKTGETTGEPERDTKITGTEIPVAPELVLVNGIKTEPVDDEEPVVVKLEPVISEIKQELIV